MQLCSVEKCGRKQYAKGLCKKHYQISWLAMPGYKTCSVAGCYRRYHCRGLCQKHYGGLPDVKNRDSARKCTRLKADPVYRAKQNIKKHARHATRRHTDSAFKIKDNARIHAHRDQRRHTDCFFKFKNGIRSLIFGAFKNKKVKKDSKTAQILGCSFEEAMKYTGWFPGCELHHIIFLNTAKTEEDVIKLNHYTNLVAMTKEAHKKLHKEHGKDNVGF